LRAAEPRRAPRHESQLAQQARQAAEVERRKAEEFGQEAERQRKLADTRAGSLREEVDRANRNLKAAREIALSVTSMFDRQVTGGRPREALTTLDQWLQLQREEYRAKPDNEDARKLLGILEGRRCVIVAMDNPLMAPASCQESARLLEALVNTPRDDEWLRINLAIAHSTLGKLRTLFGKADEGIALCRPGIDDLQAAYHLNPGDSHIRQKEAVLRLNLADALASGNHIEEAIRAHGESYRILRDLNQNAENASAYMLLGVSGMRFSKILAKKNPGRAEQLMSDALGMLRGAADGAKASIMEWNEYANALNECPYPHLHNKEAALTYARRARRGFQKRKSQRSRYACLGLLLRRRPRPCAGDRASGPARCPSGVPNCKTYREELVAIREVRTVALPISRALKKTCYPADKCPCGCSPCS